MRVLLVLLLLLLAGGCAPPGRSRHAAVTWRSEVGAAAVLSAWDHRRSQAWAAGSAPELRALYDRGSRTAASDLRMLRVWRSRGLTVSGLTTQLLSVEVLSGSADRLRLRVIDRVVRATATGPDLRRALPQDQPSAYVVVMVRRRGDWLIEEVRNA